MRCLCVFSHSLTFLYSHCLCVFCVCVRGRVCVRARMYVGMCVRARVYACIYLV